MCLEQPDTFVVSSSFPYQPKQGLERVGMIPLKILWQCYFLFAECYNMGNSAEYTARIVCVWAAELVGM